VVETVRWAPTTPVRGSLPTLSMHRNRPAIADLAGLAAHGDGVIEPRQEFHHRMSGGAEPGQPRNQAVPEQTHHIGLASGDLGKHFDATDDISMNAVTQTTVVGKSVERTSQRICRALSKYVGVLNAKIHAARRTGEWICAASPARTTRPTDACSARR